MGIKPAPYDGRDVAICYLNTKIDSAAGFLLPLEAPENQPVTRDYYLEPYAWSSVGYPSNWGGAQVPAFEGAITIKQMGTQVVDGDITLSSALYADHGWSGGPLFRLSKNCPDWWGPPPCVMVGAVVTAMAGYSGAPPVDTVHVGGFRMYALAVYAWVDLGLKDVNTSPP